MNFVNQLEMIFIENSCAKTGFEMSKYMKNNFAFYGIKTEKRRLILNVLWKENQTEIENYTRIIVRELYLKEHREFHYCAIEIISKQFKNYFIKADIELIEYMLVTNSWWDSVDPIAKNILGKYLLQFPGAIHGVIENFSNSENIWLNRSAIIFQLGYKRMTNFEILISQCEKHKNSKIFFIQKAIGWALREYAKINPKIVKEYVINSNLKHLSRKEALKNLFKD